MIAQLNDIAQIWWQWMGSMLWQVSLLIILVTVLDMVIRKWAWPQVRYALWALVFIKLIITPAWQMPTSIVSWIQPQVENQVTFKVEASEEAEKSPSSLKTHDEVKAPVIMEQASWQSIALLTWFSGIVLFSLMLLRKMYKFRKMNPVHKKTNTPEWFAELMTKTAERLKLRKTPSILFSEDAKSPAVYGVFRPVLLLPHGSLDKLSKEQVEHVLMHELCHLKRGDLLVHWFCIVVQLAYWFNPLLIWTRRQMRYICEICCDLSVANILKEKTMSYRETLLHSARELFAENLEPSLGFLGIFEEPFRLVPRLEWLEKRSWENRKRMIAATICATLFMVVCVMPMAGNSQTSDYGSDVINSNQDQEAVEVISRDQILYELLIMETDTDKKIDFAFTDISITLIQQSNGMKFVNFKDSITVDGESIKNFDELIKHMQADPDVNVLSIPKIIAANGSTATMSSGLAMDSSNRPGIQIKISPTQITEDNYITQNFELGTIDAAPDEDPAQNSKKKINTALMFKDGDTIMISGITYEDTSSFNNIKKKLYLLFTPHVIKKSSAGDEDISLQNSDERSGFVQMDFEDVDIKHLINFISEITGKNFIVSKEVKGKVTIIAPSKVTVEEAYDIFESTLEVHGFTARTVGNVTKIVKANPYN